MSSEIVIKQLVVGPLAVCCYLVGCPLTKETAIIDPGGEEEKIINTIETMTLKPIIIINTHGHPDHTAGNQKLKRVFNIPIAMHKADRGVLLDQLNLLLGGILNATPPPKPDILLNEADSISIGKFSLKVIYTPGHTSGSICLYNPGHVFTGDSLFVGGVGRTDFPGGSWEKLMSSIKEKLFTLPEETIVWPGHNYAERPYSTIREEKGSNPFIT
jgi:glyoxylase-like metal-dependent hydrolase (beta-lactamase superfamily II)